MRRNSPTLMRFVKLCLTFCLAVFFAVHSSAQVPPSKYSSSQGFVEAVKVDPLQRTITVSGWVASNNPSIFVTNLTLVMDHREIYRGRFASAERPDVVAATGRKDWLLSGFRVVVDLPHGVAAGSVPLEVFARLGDGSSFELNIAPELQLVSVSTPHVSGIWQIGLLVIVIALPLLIFAGSWVPSLVAWPWASLFGSALFLSFLILVAGGWTGSSFGLALRASPMIEHDAKPWRGEDRWVRSDEWELNTPLAISQAYHSPPYPVVNKLLGSDGQNMMVIGMTGVPVAHISSLAKPATWGFFLFDLRAALAWYWWFPFFACFAALWRLLVRLFELDWRLAAALSLTVSASPYAVVFSGWPAYVVFFPMVALLASEQIFLQRKIWPAALLGGLLGWSLAGFAMVLYPSWQISIAYLTLPLAVAWFWTLRKRLNWKLPQAIGCFAALATATAILLAWWLDAQEAVDAIRSTLYPGGRNVEAGGDIDPWFLIKGWLSPVTMYGSSELMVPSDAGSFICLLWVALPAVFYRWFKLRQIDAVSFALVAVSLLMLTFAFIGFNKHFASVTLLGFTTTYRIDLVLGLGQTLLFGWLMSPSAKDPSPITDAWKYAFVTATLLAVTSVVWLVGKLPTVVSQMVPPGFLLLTYVAIGIASYGLLVGRHSWVIVALLAWTLSASIPFNPLGLATNHLTVVPSLAQTLSALDTKKESPSLAIVGERVWAMTLPAAGLHVVNTAFYYPQKTVWASLDQDRQNTAVYNRFHRFLLQLRKLPPGSDHLLENPRLDEVRVSLDPDRFNFKLLGATAVLVSPSDGKRIRNNPSVMLVKSTEQWELFRVVN